MRGKSGGRATSKRESRRIFEKKSRQSSKNALRGLNPKETRRGGWSSRPIPVEAPDWDNQGKKKTISKQNSACPLSPLATKRHYYEDKNENTDIYGFVYNEHKKSYVYKEVGEETMHYRQCQFCNKIGRGRKYIKEYSIKEFYKMSFNGDSYYKVKVTKDGYERSVPGSYVLDLP